MVVLFLVLFDYSVGMEGLVSREVRTDFSGFFAVFCGFLF